MMKNGLGEKCNSNDLVSCFLGLLWTYRHLYVLHDVEGSKEPHSVSCMAQRAPKIVIRELQMWTVEETVPSFDKSVDSFSIEKNLKTSMSSVLHNAYGFNLPHTDPEGIICSQKLIIDEIPSKLAFQ